MCHWRAALWRAPGFNDAVITQFRASAGEVTSGPQAGRKLLLLTTVGAKSGTEQTAPLIYSMAGDRYVIAASKGGAPKHPDWFLNLRANPQVTVEVGAERFTATATVAEPEEYRRALYDAHAVPHPFFLDYEKKTTRRIPIVLLERTERTIPRSL